MNYKYDGKKEAKRLQAIQTGNLSVQDAWLSIKMDVFADEIEGGVIAVDGKDEINGAVSAIKSFWSATDAIKNMPVKNVMRMLFDKNKIGELNRLAAIASGFMDIKDAEDLVYVVNGGFLR